MFDIQDLFSRVFRFALSLSRNRDLAEDIAQESLLRAIQKNVIQQAAPVNAPSAEELWAWSNDSLNITWLFRVARNQWIDRLKSADHRKKSDANLDHVIDSSQLSPLELDEELGVVMKQMMELPETQRQVLYLRAVEEMTIEEIGTAMDISRNAVKSNLSLARKKMRSCFAKPTPAN